PVSGFQFHELSSVLSRQFQRDVAAERLSFDLRVLPGGQHERVTMCLAFTQTSRHGRVVIQGRAFGLFLRPHADQTERGERGQTDGNDEFCYLAFCLTNHRWGPFHGEKQIKLRPSCCFYRTNPLEQARRRRLCRWLFLPL